MEKETIAQPVPEIIDSLLYGENGTKSKYPDIGLVIGVCHQDQVFYAAYGTRNKNGNDQLESTSIFEIGSVTKTFTALLLAESILEGRVLQDDCIDNYLPEEIALPAALQKKVKLTDLASHQSGLPNLTDDNFFLELMQKDPGNPFRFVDKSYLYDVLKKTDVLDNYGSYHYNNYAYALLGDILERIHGQPYELLVEERILRPFKMADTSFEIPDHANVAGLYSQEGEPQNFLILEAINPAGGLKSNAVDLMKYLKAHMKTQQSNKAISICQQTYYKDKERTVGLGWDIKDDYFQKDGETLGNSCLARYSIVKQVAVVVLSDHQNSQIVSDAVDNIYGKLCY